MPETAELPAHASIVVIGGGVMGCSTLYHLARLGVADALLLERNTLTSGTTWHSAAQVRALRSTRNLTDLIRYSVSLYAELEHETGQATGWLNTGSLSIATNPDRLIHIRRQQALAKMFGVAAQFIDAGEARARWPLMRSDDVIGAVWSPEDGRVSPSDLCAVLIKGARARGARVFEHTAVTGVLTHAGRIAGLETSRGALRCDAIAVCAGLWSREVAALAGVAAPVWPCEHFYLLTRPVAGAEGPLPTLSDHDGHLYIRDESQGLLVGCFEPHARALDPARLGADFAFQLLPEDWTHFEPMMVNALHRLPVLAEAEVRTLLNGPESFTPDGSFLLGEAAETRGCFLGCGMNSVGVASGGGAGMALAHCIVHGQPPFELPEADPARFPDCLNQVAALSARVPEVLGRHYEISYPVREMRTARGLRPSPLAPRWREHGAWCAQVFGWERPLCFGLDAPPPASYGRPAWFEQVGTEVRAASGAVAVFDQSTLGKIAISGPDAESFLDRVCSNDMRRAAGRAIYTAMLDEHGAIRADLIALRLDTERYRLYTGSAAIKRDLAWLARARKTGERVHLEDATTRHALYALAGPQAAALVRALGAGELATLGFYRHAPASLAGIPVRAVRLSFVGEAGWELSCDATRATALYDALLEAGAVPAGTLAQRSMRIEKGFPVMGRELDAEVTPLEAGLTFAVCWDKVFCGRSALRARRQGGIRRRLVSIVLEDIDAWPLGNEPVYAGDTLIGRTTSAAFGYRIGHPLALGYVDIDVLSHTGPTPVQIDIAGKLCSAAAHTTCAFDPQAQRMRGA